VNSGREELLTDKPSASPGTSEPNEAMSWWSRPSAWVGIVEIVAGFLVGLAGVFLGFAYDSSVPLLVAVLGFSVGIVGLCLPGLILISRSRYRWWGQVIPFILLALYLLALRR